MGNFVQGVGDVARYGKEAYRASRDQASSMRHADARRKLEGGLGRMTDEIATLTEDTPKVLRCRLDNDRVLWKN